MAIKWLQGRRYRKAAKEAAAEEATREAWHNFWDMMNVANGGKSIPYKKEMNHGD